MVKCATTSQIAGASCTYVRCSDDGDEERDEALSFGSGSNLHLLHCLERKASKRLSVVVNPGGSRPPDWDGHGWRAAADGFPAKIISQCD